MFSGGHANVTTTVRYLGLRTEDLQKAGKTLAARGVPPTRAGFYRKCPEKCPVSFEN